MGIEAKGNKDFSPTGFTADMRDHVPDIYIDPDNPNGGLRKWMEQNPTHYMQVRTEVFKQAGHIIFQADYRGLFAEKISDSLSPATQSDSPPLNRYMEYQLTSDS
ncbi:MAG TPA: hypothetical protein VLF90_00825 [Patescibacteria group bacterium]|nr:hypothetical protein [Patescibacteria group bacterium]